ncbi:hypothetical protein D3C87_948330 [compost metagenome]
MTLYYSKSFTERYSLYCTSNEILTGLDFPWNLDNIATKLTFKELETVCTYRGISIRCCIENGTFRSKNIQSIVPFDYIISNKDLKWDSTYLSNNKNLSISQLLIIHNDSNIDVKINWQVVYERLGPNELYDKYIDIRYIINLSRHSNIDLILKNIKIIDISLMYKFIYADTLLDILNYLFEIYRPEHKLTKIFKYDFPTINNKITLKQIQLYESLSVKYKNVKPIDYNYIISIPNIDLDIILHLKDRGLNYNILIRHPKFIEIFESCKNSFKFNEFCHLYQMNDHVIYELMCNDTSKFNISTITRFSGVAGKLGIAKISLYENNDKLLSMYNLKVDPITLCNISSRTFFLLSIDRWDILNKNFIPLPLTSSFNDVDFIFE